MTKETFVALCTEEGLTTAEAGLIWGHRETADLIPETVRRAARDTLPIALEVRKVMKAHGL